MKTIILIAGRARVGKNTFSDFLTKEFNRHNLTVTQDAFAKGVKDNSKVDFKPLTNWLNDYVEQIKAQIGSLNSFNRNAAPDAYLKIENMLNQLKTKDENWYEEKTGITRLLLQIYGTTIFRNKVDTNYWAKQLKDRFLNSITDITISSDTRFPSEIEIFNEQNEYKLIVAHIERQISIDPHMATHESEIALDGWNSYDYLINNNNNLEELNKAAITVVNDILSN